MISSAITIARKELLSLFTSPIAYGIATLVLAGNGFTFYLWANLTDGNLSDTTSLFFGRGLFYWFLAPILAPLLTMRLFAEEKRTGTIEMLMTAPVTDAAVVLGKFAAVWAYYALLWVPAWIYFLGVGGNPDLGVVASAFLGALLVGALFLAVGLFASSTTANQVLAASGAVVGNLALLFLPLLAVLVMHRVSPAWAGARGFLERYSIFQVGDTTFLNGILDSGSIVYLLSLTGFFLFLTVRTVEARKWK